MSRAQQFGFIGAAPIADEIARSLAFCRAPAPGLAIDLGSGGGLPALVLALNWPTSRWVLVESNKRRAHWLSEVLPELGLQDRCAVACERAEVLGHGSLRCQADLVTARSFGPPGATAECASPLLKIGGALVVAEPPGGGGERWQVPELALIGLAFKQGIEAATSAGPVSLAYLERATDCPPKYPRRVGIPSKRPLF